MASKEEKDERNNGSDCVIELLRTASSAKTRKLDLSRRSITEFPSEFNNLLKIEVQPFNKLLAFLQC